MIKDYELLRNAELLLSKRLIIWGAGMKGKELAEKLVIWNSAIEFVDSDEKKIGYYHELPINFPRHIGRYYPKDIAIVLSPEDIELQKSIMEQIELLNYQDVDTYTRFAVEGALCFLRNSTPELTGDKEKRVLLKRIASQDTVINRLNSEVEILKQMFLARLSDKSVYIYQPKKVGSITLVGSARRMGVYGVHVHGFFGNEEWEECFVRESIKKSSGKVISIVREPVARQISLMWHIWGKSTETLLHNYQSLDELEKKTYLVPNEDDEFEWFKNEFQRVLNINIYDYPFDRDLGYSIIENDGISVLLLKLEKMNSLENVIGEFLEIENFKLTDENVAQQKNYFLAYKNYLEHVEIPLEFLDYYYNGNVYMDYFYSDSEKKQFYKKWEKHVKK